MFPPSVILKFPWKILKIHTQRLRVFKKKRNQSVYWYYLRVFPRRVFEQCVWFPSESVPPRPVLVLRQKCQDVCMFGEFEQHQEKCAQKVLYDTNM